MTVEAVNHCLYITFQMSKILKGQQQKYIFTYVNRYLVMQIALPVNAQVLMLWAPQMKFPSLPLYQGGSRYLWGRCFQVLRFYLSSIPQYTPFMPGTVWIYLDWITLWSCRAVFCRHNQLSMYILVNHIMFSVKENHFSKADLTDLNLQFQFSIWSDIQCVGPVKLHPK